MPNTESGKMFENKVLALMMTFEEFFDDNPMFLNVFNYSDKIHKNIFDKNKIFLYKNYPYKIKNKIRKHEFFIHDGINKLRFRIECKFENVDGTAHEKWDYHLRRFPSNDETHFFLVYGGDFHRRNPHHLSDVIEKWEHKENLFIYNLAQFESFLLKYYTKKVE